MNNSTINKLRKDIDETDKKIMKLIEKRFSLVSHIGLCKMKKKIPIIQRSREEDILRNQLARKKINHQFVKKFYTLVFSEGRKIQKKQREL